MKKSLFILLMGVGIGMLFAPAKGKETRRKLRKVIEDLVDDTEEKVDEISGMVRESLEPAF
jgi:gas vesicle protein